MSVVVKYGAVAVGAKENFTVSTPDKTDFVNLSDFQQDLTFVPAGNPCEFYNVILSNGNVALPDTVAAGETIGLWSESLTDANGEFETPIVLTLTANEQYSSSGFTFKFDTVNQIYPQSINIKWYQADTLLDDVDFTPDNANYFCYHKANDFDKVVITFYDLNMPYTRLKLLSIAYGYDFEFTDRELRSVNIIKEIHPIALTVPIGTCDLSVDSDKIEQVMFQKNQKIDVFFNGDLQLTGYISEAKRTGKRLADISIGDVISKLDNTLFDGGLYNSVSLASVVSQISELTNTTIDLDSSYSSETLTGWLPVCSCREAIQQIAFSLGATIKVISATVNIVPPPTSASQHISADRIKTGQAFENDESYTDVFITAHNYTADSNTEAMIVFSTTDTSIYGDTTGLHKIVFLERVTGTDIVPFHSISLTGTGTITEQGANYVVVNATGACQVTAKPYVHRTTKRERHAPIVAGEARQSATIENATLVNTINVDNILDNCYNFFTNKNAKTSMSIREGFSQNGTPEQAVNVGDIVTFETEYYGTLRRQITRESYSLKGGVVWKNCETD